MNQILTEGKMIRKIINKKTITILSLLLIISSFVFVNIDSLAGFGLVQNTEDKTKSEDVEVFIESNRATYSKTLIDKFKAAQEKIVNLRKKKTQTIQLSENDLYSNNVCLMNAKTGEIIYAIKENEVVFPASLTKMMTTLVAVDEIKNYDQIQPITEELYTSMIADDASMAGYLPNEKINLRDLIYGTMLPSGGEASVGLAEGCSGSEAAHVAKMNEKAKEIGLRRTNFMNVSGLHDPKNYSTAKEMAEIVRYGLQDETFAKIFTIPHYISSQTEEHPDGVYMMYSVLAYMDSAPSEGFKILGGKTGYTEQAGLCLASTAIVGDEQYILVTLGALPYDAGSKFHFEDAVTIYRRLAETKSEIQ